MFKIKVAAAAVAAFLSVGAAHAACDTAAIIEACKGKLDDGYKVLNTYPLDSVASKKHTFSDDNVLTTRMSYQVAICGPDADKTEFALESGTQQHLLDNKSGDALQPMVTFKPERMSVHVLVFKGPENAEMCAGAVLGMKR